MKKMIIRRYYRKGIKYPYTIGEKYLQELVEKKGQEEAWRIDNASYEIILQSKEEQVDWFNDCLNRVLANPRFYLDNLDKLPTFKVRIKEILPKKGNTYKLQTTSSND